jgi:hypothetical protein
VIRLRRLLSIFFALPGAALALGLGEPSGHMVIGQPMSVRIPLQGLAAGKLETHCVKLMPTPGEISDASLATALVRVEGAAVAIGTRSALTQPILSFRLKIECGFQLMRDYQILPLPPQLEAAPSQVVVKVPTVAALAPAAAPAAKLAPVPAAKGSATDVTIATPTTLRLMSRQRHPGDARARVNFIRRVAAANPEVFDDIAAAYDQSLPAGQTLRLPDNLPRQGPPPAPPPKPTVKPAVKPPPAAAAAAGTQAANTATPKTRPAESGERLIIGAQGAPTPSVAEIEADLDRLVGIMNDHVQVQIAMVERIKKLEEDVARSKEAFAVQQAAAQRLEAEIRQLREEQQRGSIIQLVLAVLLGGFAGSALLRWRAQRRRQPSVVSDDPPASPSVIEARAASLPRSAQADLADLLPPK